MLTTAEEDRLEADLPLTQSIPYDGATYQYELTPYWYGPDHQGDDADLAPEYPAIVFQWESQSDERDERRPLGGVDRVDDRGDDPEFAEIHAAGYDDELSITVAVKATHDANGVPPDVRGKQLARQLFRYIRFQIDLNTTGPNGERPMLVDPANAPTPARVDRTYRVEWSVAISYVDEHTVVHDTVDDAEYTVDTT
jgi:hypothetical protein